VALSFGPPEYFALTFMGLTLVTSLAGESMLKGIMSGVFGLIVACVGIDAVSGEERFTFGILSLLDGAGFIGVAVGLFAVSEVLCNLEESMEQVFIKAKFSLRSLFPNRQDWKDSFWPIIRGSFLGFFIGILPGAGAVLLQEALHRGRARHPQLVVELLGADGVGVAFQFDLEARVLAQHLGPVVAGHLFERGVDVLDVPGAVGHEHGIGGQQRE
jgi:putative tricarboxylic transport membrane protein